MKSLRTWINPLGAAALALTMLTALTAPTTPAWGQTRPGGPQPSSAQAAPSQAAHRAEGQSSELFVAVTRDNASAVTRLLERGMDPNVRDAKGQTPMVLALQLGSLRAFDALMASARTNVEFRNAHDESPLMMAAIRGHRDAVVRLERQGAHVNKPLWTPLHYAAAGTSDEQVRITDFLLEKHAFIDAQSPNGTTPLMMAAQYGTEGVVRLLMESDADPLMKNQLGLTAVDFAKRAGRERLAQELARYEEHVRQRRMQGSPTPPAAPLQ